VLQTQSLKYQYPSGKPLVFPDIHFPDEQPALILGESGCGKTTLLHLLAGLRTPSEGNVILGQTNLYSLTTSERDAFRGKNIGVVFQTAHFIPSLSVLENIMMSLYLNGKVQDENKAKDFLNRVNLFHKAFQPIGSLSVGEQQRIAIVRSIIHEPQWIFADEPTSALDNKNADQVIHLFMEMTKTVNAQLVVVTHDNRWDNVIANKVQL
jgi:putative ABC transport system ATP-binding protein